MNEEKNETRTTASSILIAIPILILFIYFVLPGIILAPFYKIYGPERLPVWMDYIFAPIDFLVCNFDWYADFALWQMQILAF